jgi:hypothetical protein
MRPEDKEDAQAALRSGGARPNAASSMEALSRLLKGSQDAVVCADLAPLADGQLGGRDLLRRCIIHDGAYKVLTTPNPRTGSFVAGLEQSAPAFVIDAMNGTGASPAVRIKGRQV